MYNTAQTTHLIIQMEAAQLFNDDITKELGDKCKVVFASFVMNTTCRGGLWGGGCLTPTSPLPHHICQLI
jgi:hypothetical protein